MRRRFFLILVIALALMTPVQATAQDASTTDESWWRPYFLIDYGLIAVGAATYVIAGRFGPRYNTPIGPQYDPDDPAAIFNPDYSDRIGRHYLDEGSRETVPVPHLLAIAAGTGGVLALQEAALWLWSDLGSARHFHEVMVGYAEMQALTGGLTEVSKVVVGRLRPDFQDRAARHLCNTDPPEGFDCGPYEGRPLSDDPTDADHIFTDGRKSYWSGHSAFGLSTFTYTSLVVGGRWVWGENSTPTTRAMGIFAQLAFMSTGIFIAGSRFDDGRHHANDVFVGSVVGVGLANFAYWRRFDTKGNFIRGKKQTALRLEPGPGTGLSLVLEH